MKTLYGIIEILKCCTRREWLNAAIGFGIGIIAGAICFGVSIIIFESTRQTFVVWQRQLTIIVIYLGASFMLGIVMKRVSHLTITLMAGLTFFTTFLVIGIISGTSHFTMGMVYGVALFTIDKLFGYGHRQLWYSQTFFRGLLVYKNQLMAHLRIYQDMLGFWPEVDYDANWLAVNGGQLNDTEGATCFASYKMLEGMRRVLGISDAYDRVIRTQVRARTKYYST